MPVLAMLRHGPTAWNEARRLQGRTDIPLSPVGRAAVLDWRLPPALAGFAWATSPLARCRETLALLRRGPFAAVDWRVEPRLAEMSYGDWEGRTLAALRAAHPAMPAWEARGLDFTPPGGESPRMVQQRLAPWLAATAAAGVDTLAVTHKGVIRALYALAAGWTMQAKPPHRLERDALHCFALAADGGLAIERLNIPLPPPEGAP